MIGKILLFLLILFGIYMFFLLYLHLFQSSFVFFPSKQQYMTPEDVNLKYRDITYKTEDGVNISSWFIPSDQSEYMILFCHGNAGNISHRVDSIELFHRLGLSTFIFDYRGYGKSKGKITEKGTYMDVEGAWDYIVDELGVKPENIIIFGRSIGGSIASWLAQKKNPKALIVESSFTSITDLGSELYPVFPVRLISKFKYNTKEYIKNIKCPVLIIHSKEDEMIPFHHGQTLFESAKDPKEFLQIHGSHNEGFIFSQEIYAKGLREFILNL